MSETGSIRRTILRKMFSHGYIGGRHTSLDNLPKGFPSHIRKEVKKIARKLIKEGLLLRKPTHCGEQVSLNPERIDEIRKEIAE